MCLKKYPCEKEKDSNGTYLIVKCWFLQRGEIWVEKEFEPVEWEVNIISLLKSPCDYKYGLFFIIKKKNKVHWKETYNNNNKKTHKFKTWPVWLRWLECCPMNFKRLWVQSPDWMLPRDNRSMFLSVCRLPLSFPLSKISKTYPLVRIKKHIRDTWHTLISTKECVIYSGIILLQWKPCFMEDSLWGPNRTESLGLRLLLSAHHQCNHSELGVSWQLSNLFCGEFESTLSFWQVSA